jgi:hypothetical protein
MADVDARALEEIEGRAAEAPPAMADGPANAAVDNAASVAASRLLLNSMRVLMCGLLAK